MVKNLPTMQKTWVSSPGLEDPLKKKWQPTPICLPRESHGQMSLWATVMGSQRVRLN